MVVSWWIEMWKSGDIPDQAVYLHVLEPQVNVEIQQRAEKNTSSASRRKPRGIAASRSHRISWAAAFLPRRLCGLVPLQRGCINTFFSPAPRSSPWADVDGDAMLTYCLVLLACFLSEWCIASGVWLGSRAGLVQCLFVVRLKLKSRCPLCATVGVSLETAASTQLWFSIEGERLFFFFFFSLSAAETLWLQIRYVRQKFKASRLGWEIKASLLSDIM